MRRRRCRGRSQGAGASWSRGAQDGGRSGPSRCQQRARTHGPGTDRAGGGLQTRRRRESVAQDAVGQDPAQLDPQDRRRGGVFDPGKHRGPSVIEDLRTAFRAAR